MLRDRKYAVADAELNMTFQQFDQEYNSRDDMTIKVPSLEDEREEIFVFFPEDDKLAVKPIRDYCQRVEPQQVGRALIVVKEAITPMAKRSIQAVRKNLWLEHFQQSELMVNITHHTLVPVHQLLSDAQKQELLKRYRIVQSQLPRIQADDPV